MKVQNIVVTEKYTDKQGQEKKAYKTIGKMFTYDDGGVSIKIEMVPVGAWDGNANVYDIQPKQTQNSSHNSGQYGQQQAPQQQAYNQQGQPNPQYDPNPKQGQYNAPQVVQQNIPNDPTLPF